MELLAGRSVALVHEWFARTGGSEQVFLAMAELVPHAARYVLWAEPDPRQPRRVVRQSWLGHTPLRRSKALALPLMPLVWRTLSRSRFDVVISSSHAFAHTVRLGPPEVTRYLSYVHSPARYLWSPGVDTRGTHPLFRAPRSLLRAADTRLSRHVHAYAANSREVQARIKRYWRRDATVIHPPVDVDFFAAVPPGQPEQSRDYLLGVGRWVSYKNFDLMIEIAANVRMPLVIAGFGPQAARLRRLASAASVPVTFEVAPDRERLRQLYRGARALLYPAHEDFGMIPVEAQACGTPVVGLRRGGLIETVIDGETGLLVDCLDPRAFADAIRRLPSPPTERLQAHARTFATQQFRRRISAWVTDVVG